MLDIFNEDSKAYKKVIHETLDIVVEFFLEVGGHLDYDEIYGSVFPLHKKDEEGRGKQGLAFLKKLHREIVDNFSHEFSPLKEYVLYHILLFVHEGSEETFILSDVLQESLKNRDRSSFNEDEISVLNSIETPEDLIGICFSDLDFLDVEEIFDIYKKNPTIVADFLHIDLEYYKDLLPEDILSEYREIQEDLKLKEKSTIENTDIKVLLESENTKDDFYAKVDSLIATFKFLIENKKGHVLFKNKAEQATEDKVQVLFNLLAIQSLKDYGIVTSPEVDTGRGIVDFQLSKGADLQALVELKLGNNGRYEDGLDFQLPIYLLTEQVDYGFFVLVCYTQKIYEDAHSLYQKADELSQKYNKKIKFERIDASGTLKSASKVRTEKDMGF